MNLFKVTVKRQVVLTTELHIDAEDHQAAADFITDMTINTGELGSVESWIEESPYEWKIEEAKDSVALVEELQ